MKNFIDLVVSIQTGFLKNRNIPSIVGKAFIVFGFVFLVPGISQSKIKIDREAVKAVNAGIQSHDSIELVLKYFFKKTKDQSQIEGDVAQMAKHLKKMNWYAESDGNDGLFVKSKKKVL